MKLPVTAILVDAYRLFFANLDVFARLVWFPVVVQFAAALFARNYLPALDAEEPGRFTLYAASIEVCAMVLAIPASTAWCRLVIFGRDAGNARLSYSFRAEELRYLIRGGLILLISFTIAGSMIMVAWSVPPIEQAMENRLVGEFVLLTFLGCAYLCIVRFLLVLPAAAIGRKERFIESFRMTRGNGLKLFLLMLLAFFPWLFCNQILEHSFFTESSGYERVEPIEYLIAEAINTWFFFTIDISAMAMAYKMLMSQTSHGKTSASLRSNFTS